jgi:hypothetical protein
MIWGQVNLENVAKAGNPPIKRSKNVVLSCEIIHVMFEQVIIMLVGNFGKLIWGSANVHVTQTVLAAGPQWVEN